MRKPSIVTVADHGDRLETLKILRHKIAQTLRDTQSARDIPALSRQLREVMAEIEELSATPEAHAENVSVLAMVRAKHKEA